MEIFLYPSLNLWNSLSQDMLIAPGLNTFKRELVKLMEGNSSQVTSHNDYKQPLCL